MVLKYNDVLTTTLAGRTKDLHDNMSKNSALLWRLQQKGKMKPINGGSKILEELEYGEGDIVWYSGYDTISYNQKQLFTAAEYALKLCAVPVAISGEELLMNSGEAMVMDLLENVSVMPKKHWSTKWLPLFMAMEQALLEKKSVVWLYWWQMILLPEQWVQ